MVVHSLRTWHKFSAQLLLFRIVTKFPLICWYRECTRVIVFIVKLDKVCMDRIENGCKDYHHSFYYHLAKKYRILMMLMFWYILFTTLEDKKQ